MTAQWEHCLEHSEKHPALFDSQAGKCTGAPMECRETALLVGCDQPHSHGNLHDIGVFVLRLRLGQKHLHLPRPRQREEPSRCCPGHWAVACHGGEAEAALPHPQWPVSAGETRALRMRLVSGGHCEDNAQTLQELFNDGEKALWPKFPGNYYADFFAAQDIPPNPLWQCFKPL